MHISLSPFKSLDWHAICSIVHLRRPDKNMELKKAIKTAINYETKIRDLYLKSVNTCQDDTGCKVLQILAREEQEHIDHLAAMLKELEESGKITPKELKSAIPSNAKIAKSVARLKEKSANDRQSSDLDLLKLALEIEKETSDFYSQMVNTLNAEGQELFEPFVEIENGHISIVQAEMDNLNGLGFWFDFQEFDLEG
jgi:rubrerythrin